MGEGGGEGGEGGGGGEGRGWGGGGGGGRGGGRHRLLESNEFPRQSVGLICGCWTSGSRFQKKELTTRSASTYGCLIKHKSLPKYGYICLTIDIQTVLQHH